MRKICWRCGKEIYQRRSDNKWLAALESDNVVCEATHDRAKPKVLSYHEPEEID